MAAPALPRGVIAAPSGHFAPAPRTGYTVKGVGRGNWQYVPVKAAAPKPAVPLNSPLLNPNTTLGGKSLLDAAQALTNVQTVGPSKQLAQQLAQNTRQGQAAQTKTAGYFNYLGSQARAGSDQETGIANDLNSQLQGISDQTQSKIAGFGQQAQASPQLQSLAASGLDGGALGNLASQLAQRQASSAQDAQTYRSAGAEQGANYRGLAASNLGTYALRGQERLGQIAQATRLAAEPINTQIATLNANRGNLLKQNIGSLRQQEFANQQTALAHAIAQEGVNAGLTKAQIAANTSAANNLLTNQTSAANNLLTNQTRTASGIANAFAGVGKAAAKAQADAKKQAAANAQKQAAAGVVKPMTPVQNTSYWSRVAKGIAAYSAGRTKGQTPQQIMPQLLAGGLTPLQAQVAMQLWTYHYINPSTASQLHSAGVRGGSYLGAPIKVGAPKTTNLGLTGTLTR